MSRTRIFLCAIVGMLLVPLVVWVWGGVPLFVTSEVEIRVAPKGVFPYLLEPEKQKQWVSGFVEARLQDQDGSSAAAEFAGVGSPRIEVIEKGGKRVEVETGIIRLESDQLVEVRMSSQTYEAVNHFDLAATAQGTKLTQNLTVTYKGLSRFLAPFTHEALQQELWADLRRLKAAVEKAVPVRAP